MRTRPLPLSPSQIATPARKSQNITRLHLLSFHTLLGERKPRCVLRSWTEGNDMFLSKVKPDGPGGSASGAVWPGENGRGCPWAAPTCFMLYQPDPARTELLPSPAVASSSPLLPGSSWQRPSGVKLGGLEGLVAHGAAPK